MDVKASTLRTTTAASLASLVVTAVPAQGSEPCLACISGQLSLRRASLPDSLFTSLEVRLVEVLTGLDEHIACNLGEGRFSLQNVPVGSGHRLSLSLPPSLSALSGLAPHVELYLPLELLGAETTELMLIVSFVDRDGDGRADCVELDMRQSCASMAGGSFWRSFRPDAGEAAGALVPVGKPAPQGWLSRRIKAVPKEARRAQNRPLLSLSPLPEMLEMFVPAGAVSRA